MHMTSHGRSSAAQTTLVSLVTVGSIAILGWVLSYWTWVWFAPAPEMRQQPALESANLNLSAGTLFGNAQSGRSPAVPTGVAISLLGVIAAAGQERGYAVLKIDARQLVAVREGNIIVPGVRLAEVHADHIILERGEVRETLAWARKSAAAENAVLQSGQQGGQQSGR